MEHETGRVYITVLNWNQYELTAGCVRSLLSLDYPDYRIVVVDNGSQDGTVDKMQKEFDEQIDLIANAENLGFTGGNNVGIRYAIEQGADYVMLLNNDTIANDPELLSKLAAALDADSSIGLVSPSIHYLDAPDRAWYAGSVASLWTGWKHRHQVPSDRALVDTGYASGCCVLASARMIEEIGPLNESYFITVEDVEWSFRARRAGWRVVYLPGADLLHKVSATSGDKTGRGVRSPVRVYYETRNTIWLIRQYGNPIQRWLMWPVLLVFRWTYLLAGYVVLRRWPKLRALWRAIRDGIVTSPASL